MKYKSVSHQQRGRGMTAFHFQRQMTTFHVETGQLDFSETSGLSPDHPEKVPTMCQAQFQARVETEGKSSAGPVHEALTASNGNARHNLSAKAKP